AKHEPRGGAWRHLGRKRSRLLADLFPECLVAGHGCQVPLSGIPRLEEQDGDRSGGRFELDGDLLRLGPSGNVDGLDVPWVHGVRFRFVEFAPPAAGKEYQSEGQHRCNRTAEQGTPPKTKSLLIGDVELD